MRQKHRHVAAFATGVLAATLSIIAVPASGTAITAKTTEEVAPGVIYEAYTYEGQPVHQLSVSIAEDHITADVLVPDAIADAEKPSTMAEAANATTVVNGDFFNNSEDGWDTYTNAPVGPMVTDNAELFPAYTGRTYEKGAVPGAQRMGPPRPGGSPNESVLGFRDGEPVMTEMNVEGEVSREDGTFPLEGVNQYGLRGNGMGYFDADWGSAERLRAACGDSNDRHAPCSENITDVLIRNGKVVDIDDLFPDTVPGENTPFEHYRPIGENEYVLFGRGAAADWLRDLNPGDSVTADWSLTSPAGDLDTALGGMPIVRDGAIIDGIPNDDPAIRTAVGYNAGGNVLYMVTVGDCQKISVGCDRDGLSLAGLSELMIEIGAVDALNLDGGGSSMMGTAEDDGTIKTRNNPSDPLGERPVANALAIFATDKRISYMEGRWKMQNGSPFAPSLLVDERGAARYVADGAYDFFGPLELSSDSSDTEWSLSSDFQKYSYLDDSITEGFTFSLSVDAGSANPTPEPGDQFTDADGNVWERQAE
ncbi:phosphodiester glycosidase family protein [Salininema proteolyticum]|uniref:Phosphodiester glycosidase family protein n=1 Tax=Salininema proteolyticum TaxID=1607685 RepID=A0ABV8TZX9_9ACTN